MAHDAACYKGQRSVGNIFYSTRGSPGKSSRQKYTPNGIIAAPVQVIVVPPLVCPNTGTLAAVETTTVWILIMLPSRHGKTAISGMEAF